MVSGARFVPPETVGAEAGAGVGAGVGVLADEAAVALLELADVVLLEADDEAAGAAEDEALDCTNCVAAELREIASCGDVDWLDWLDRVGVAAVVKALLDWDAETLGKFEIDGMSRSSRRIPIFEEFG